MSDDNFKDYPKSVSEIKSLRKNDASLSTPRDALIDMLRRIDSGEQIESMVICYRAKDTIGSYTGYRSAAVANGFEAIGIVNRVSYAINSDMSETGD